MFKEVIKFPDMWCWSCIGDWTIIILPVSDWLIEISRNKKIIDIVKKLIGGTVRFHLGKLNFKLPNKKKGSLVEWHQDFAFYPHTNDDLITVGIYLEDCDEKNGPLKVIKGSHKKELFSHHSNDNYFVGKINTKKNKINLKKSVSLTGKAGSVAIFHCRTIHGSGLNHTNGSRPLILFGYRACDAWPIICLLYTSPSPRDRTRYRMPSSA